MSWDSDALRTPATAYAQTLAATALMKMTPRIIAKILTVILLVGCRTKETSNQNEITSDTTNTDDTTENRNFASDSIKNGDDFDSTDCIRGQAESITKKTVYPDAIFKLNSDNHTGVETVDLKNGERLIINNWGCEYFVLTFRIETERFQADTTNTIYWLDKAVILMKEIEDGIDAPLNIQGGIEAIPIHMASMDSRTYELGEEIVFKDDIIRDFVTLDRVQKMSDKRFAIEISFATGPL